FRAAWSGPASVAAAAALADMAAADKVLEAVAGLAAPLPAGPAWSPHDAVGGAADGPRRVVAVLGGPAFTFGYAEHVELLSAAGAEPVTVDPLRDTALPPGTGGLVLPGGFPEEHVAGLAANEPLLAEVRRLASAGA